MRSSGISAIVLPWIGSEREPCERELRMLEANDSGVAPRAIVEKGGYSWVARLRRRVMPSSNSR